MIQSTQHCSKDFLTQLVSSPWNIFGGIITFRALTAASFNIASHLREGPKTTPQLAELTGAHAPSLYRLLRFLASIDIFEERNPETQTFANTGASFPMPPILSIMHCSI